MCSLSKWLSRATWKKSKKNSKRDKLLEQQPVSNYSSSIHFVWKSFYTLCTLCVEQFLYTLYTLCGWVSIHFVWMRAGVGAVQCEVCCVNSAVWKYVVCVVQCAVCIVRIAKSGWCHCHRPQVKIATIDGLVSLLLCTISPRIIIIRIQYFPPCIHIGIFGHNMLNFTNFTKLGQVAEFSI